MNYIEYLNIDFDNEENIDSIMGYIFDFLDEINVSDFKGGKIHKLFGVIDKFIYLAKHYSISNTYDLSGTCREFIEILIETDNIVSSQRRKACLSHFEKVNSTIHRIYNEIQYTKLNHNLLSEFLFLYNPDKSNKDKAILLIEEVIEILSIDATIPQRQKRVILKQLNKILVNLRQEKTNWTSYFGDIYQTVIILGSIGSLIGGAASVTSLRLTEKLSQSIHVIQSSSVNNNIKYSFNFFENNYYQEINDQDNQKVLSCTPLLEEKK